MGMFCYQCQETKDFHGCTLRGVCGKEANTANLQDLLIHTLKGVSILSEPLADEKKLDKNIGRCICHSLFATLTNANFDEQRFISLIEDALKIRESLKEKVNLAVNHDSLTWQMNGRDNLQAKAQTVGVVTTQDQEARSLRELLIYGLKGIAAYAEHAQVLGFESEKIYHFMVKALASTTRDMPMDKMFSLVMTAGEISVETMALLDQANTQVYGNPEITKVNLGVRNNPGILISGHDLHDLEELLKQTNGTGVDVYTHGEMLPAHYYPAFKKYDHFVGNYGSAWWQQKMDFEAFNGPILMTTNCIVPVKDSYRDRIFTTGVVGMSGVKHIMAKDGHKDFSPLIEMAKKCLPPQELERGELVGGFAHHQVLQLADKVVAAVKRGAIKRFVVMAGCDGRQKGRSYYTEVAENLPKDTVILTAGCAKYRYNKLNLGDIDGIPRVLDAGQCNDSYSLAVIALKLKEVFGLKDINELPISFDIAWYEQKAVAVLLALLYLGVKNIRLGPTLPVFLSPGVAAVLVEKFGVKSIGDVKDDIAKMMIGA